MSNAETLQATNVMKTAIKAGAHDSPSTITTTTITTTTTTVTTTTTTTTKAVERIKTNDLSIPARHVLRDILPPNAVQPERKHDPGSITPQSGQDEPVVALGKFQESQDNLSYTFFMKNLMSEDDSTFASVLRCSTEIVKNSIYRGCRQEYLSAIQGVPGARSRGKTLVKLFSCITEVAPSCDLGMAYQLEIDYVIQRFTNKEAPPQCAALLHADRVSGQGGWPLIIIQTQKPAITKLDIVLPLPQPESRTEGSNPKHKRESPEPLQKGSNKRPREVSPVQPTPPPHQFPDPQAKHNVLSSPEMPAISGMAKEAFQIMAELGTRRHIFGVLIKGLDMFLCYFDRAGSIFSSRLHLIDDELHVVAAIVLFSLCSPARLGFEPSIYPPPSSSIATTVSGCSIEVEGRRLIFDELIHSSETPFGRGTVVFSAHPTPAMGTDVPPVPIDVIVKLSWQVTTQYSEDNLMRHAAKCNVEGVAKLFLSSVAGRLSDGMRKGLRRSDKYVDRELRVQVMGPRCMPLYRVVELEDFKAAFISLVKAHHDLYEKAGILHRDISVNNLMVEPSNPRVGVLIDLDLAAIVKDQDGNDVDVKPILTGTLPFLAIELLQDTPPAKSYYRHDLESFLYVLVWICSHYSRGEAIPTNAYSEWYEGDLERMTALKTYFLTTSGPGTDITPHYQAIGSTWIRHLKYLIIDGINARRRHEETKWILGEEAGDFDYSTLGGHITYRKFMDSLLRLY